MSWMVHGLVEGLFAASVIASFIASLYVLVTFIGIRRFRRRSLIASPAHFRPPVTLFKPVCGLEFGLEENLRSFCEQDYPCFQVVFAVRAADDPAVEIIRRLIAELAETDITLIVEPSIHGANLKVSNLINAFSAAKHDILIVADSDMRVGPTYITNVVMPFREPDVGVVTCLYRGVPAGNILSQLACLQINEWFLPSVLVSGLLQGDRYCFGATMAVRREILLRAGGLRALVDVLADDHMLGKIALDQGYRIELSHYVVDNPIEERSFRALFAHELRWARTIRILSPVGHLFSILINTISVAFICLMINDLTLDIDLLEGGIIMFAVALRLALHYTVSAALGVPRPAPYWLVPLRDILSFAIWAASFLSRDVLWRGKRFRARSDGTLIQIGTPEST